MSVQFFPTYDQVLRSKFGGLIFDVREYGADPTGVQESYPAIMAALRDAWKVYGTVLLPPGGVYTVSQPIIVQPSVAGDSLAPSLVSFGSGGVTETNLTSAALLRPSSDFPSGEYLVAYLPYSSSYQLIGYECGGFSALGEDSSGTTLAAGIGVLNARQASWHDIAIANTITPAPVRTATGLDVAAFNVHQPGSPGGFSSFRRIVSSHSGNDAFWCMSQESVWDTCRNIVSGRYGFNVGNAAMTFANLSLDLSALSQINDDNSPSTYIGINSFDGPTSGPTIQLNASSNPRFVGCTFWGPQSAGNDNSGAIVNAYGGANATFAGCSFNANADTVHLVSAQAGSTGRVRIVGGSTSGAYTGAMFLNSGTGILSARDLIGLNPVGPVTVAVPASGAATAALPYDSTFYITQATAASSVAVQGQTIAIPVGGPTAIRVPAGQTLTPTYTTAPTWVVMGD